MKTQTFKITTTNGLGELELLGCLEDTIKEEIKSVKEVLY